MKHTLANIQDLIPTLVGIIISNTNQGLNLIDMLESVFHLCMHGCTTQLELCLYDQIQIIVNAACRVGSQQFPC